MTGMTLIGLGHLAKRFKKSLSNKVSEGVGGTTTAGGNADNDHESATVSASSSTAASSASAVTQQRHFQRGGAKRGGKSKVLSGRGIQREQREQPLEDVVREITPTVVRSPAAQAVLDALNDHSSVKFIGRDCRALEAGYALLLENLNPVNHATYLEWLERDQKNLSDRLNTATKSMEQLDDRYDEVVSGNPADLSEDDLLSKQEELHRLQEMKDIAMQRLEEISEQIMEAQHTAGALPLAGMVSCM